MTSPEYFIPPSAIIVLFLFLAAAAHLIMAEICGIPTPATTRVVQILPGPTPTFTTSAPAVIKASVPSLLTTFPATIMISLYLFETYETISITFFECP